jgi:uncharacterized protein (DUF433 family)
MWSVSEKVASLRQELDDPKFPRITYRRGASGIITPVLRGTGIRVQTIVTDLDNGLTHKEIADEYEIQTEQVKEAQEFYHAHTQEIDIMKKVENDLEAKYV